MAQNDFTIDNQAFPATRSDINSALQALASLSSGASSPSTTFAYQLWVNTTADPNILNIRNSANNAWIQIGEVNQGSAAFILTAYAYLQAGSAAAPSFSFDLDRDTGMYQAAANIIGFATNGTERFRVGDSGQLGIGGATYGTSGQVLTSGGAAAAPSWAANTVLVSGTVVASTSGTSISFTGLPSSVKRVMLMFSGVSTSGTNNYIIQLGYGATPTYVTSGYLGSASTQGGTSTAFSTGFMFNSSPGTTDAYSGIATITNITGNAWTMISMIGNTVNNNMRFGAGNVSTVSVLTAVRITTVGSTETFDAGSINIMYE